MEKNMENEMEATDYADDVGLSRGYVGKLPQEWIVKWNRTWRMKWKLAFVQGSYFLRFEE